MKTIASFTINHLTLLPGVYVSRKDSVGDSVVTTFDLRVTRPNAEPVMNTAEVHTIEHLAATFLRNHPDFGSRIVYLDRWAVVPDSISCLREITNLRISFRCFVNYLLLYATTKTMFRGLPQSSAAIIWT